MKKEKPKMSGNIIKRLKEAIQILTKSETAWNVTLAVSCRKFSDMILGAYLPVFFMTKFPMYKAKFAFLNGLCLAVLGLVSNMLSGTIGDALEKKYPLIKSQMLAGSAFISSAALATSFLAPVNFYVSFIVYTIHMLVSSGYQTLAITMI